MGKALTNFESRSLAQMARHAIRHYDAPVPRFANAHEAVAYALWERESKAADLIRQGTHNAALERKIGGRGGMVLTENGWEIPIGDHNPRVIEHDPKPMTAYEAAAEAQIQSEVKAFADSHEQTLKAYDRRDFLRMYRTWQLPIRFYFEPVNEQ